MNELLLLKCDNVIYAEKIVNLLKTHGITSRLHHESQDTAAGTYGDMTGIAVFVSKKYYKKALALVSPAIKTYKSVTHICKSHIKEETANITRQHRHAVKILKTSLLLLLLPGIFIVQPIDLGAYSYLADIVAIGMLISSFIILIVNCNAYNYKKWNDCDKSITA